MFIDLETVDSRSINCRQLNILQISCIEVDFLKKEIVTGHQTQKLNWGLVQDVGLTLTRKRLKPCKQAGDMIRILTGSVTLTIQC